VNLATVWLIVVAQHVHTHTPPLYVEPITIAPPSTTRAVTDNEVARIPAAPVVMSVPVVAEHESFWDRLPVWWPLIVLLGAWLVVAVRRGRKKYLDLPTRTTVGPPPPNHDDALPVPLARRSVDECRTLYIDTVRAQVRRMIGRPDIRCVLVSAAPLETRWRAWLGTTDWATANPDLRATGRSEGQALKRLLAAYQAFGSNWMGFAVERERPELAPAVSAPEVSPPEPVR